LIHRTIFELIFAEKTLVSVFILRQFLCRMLDLIFFLVNVNHIMCYKRLICCGCFAEFRSMLSRGTCGHYKNKIKITIRGQIKLNYLKKSIENQQ